MVYGGVRDVLVTNEIVGRQKLRRLMALAHVAQVGVCADDLAQVDALDLAAGEAGVDDAGAMSRSTWAATAAASSRARRRSASPAASPTRRISALPGSRPITARRSICAAGRSGSRRSPAPSTRPATTRDLLAAQRHPLRHHHRRRHRHFRIRGGQRRLYRTAMRLLHLHGRRLRPQSRPRRRADQGLRAEPLRLGDGDEPPGRGARDRRRRAQGARPSIPARRLLWDEPAATYERASDEHGRLAVTSATNRLHLGDKIRLVPGHCDPTVNLYDWYVGDPRRPCRSPLADHRSRCGVLTDGSDRIVSGL